MDYKYCCVWVMLWLCCAYQVSSQPKDDSSQPTTDSSQPTTDSSQPKDDSSQTTADSSQLADDSKKIKAMLFRQLWDQASMITDLKLLKMNHDSMKKSVDGITETLAELKSQQQSTCNKESVDGITETLAELKSQQQSKKESVDGIIETLAELKSNQEKQQTATEACVGNPGLTTIYVHYRPIQVWCDGEGWVVVQRRVDAAVNFTRGWQHYKNGFGDLSGSFWLGLEHMHRLTSTTKQAKLRVELEDWEGERRWAEYSHVRIDGESTGYRLHVSGYAGTAGDGLEYNDRGKFSTYDQDNDKYRWNCAISDKSAWWYKACSSSDLNGMYRDESDKRSKGVYWWHWKRSYHSLKKAEMKVFIL